MRATAPAANARGHRPTGLRRVPSRLGPGGFRATGAVATLPSTMPSGAKRILVVEDDQAVRESLADVLSEEGYEVTCAANGREALDRLHAAAPALILLDLVMPVMDGWTFRAAQRRDPRASAIPVVVLSASRGDDAPAAALGAEAFLPKPVDVGRLLGTLRRLAAGGSRASL
jgi:CheY-like chemotaxis protein